jgi:transglutaminase-like putative cysteine protease
MRLRSQTQSILTHLLRNLVLFFLLLHAYRQFRAELSLSFLTAVFLLSLAFALLSHHAKLRFLPASVLAAALPFLIRALCFVIFYLIGRIDPAPESDFLFLNFDRDFYPALIPWTVVWLFNFLALQSPGFAVPEVLLNALLLLTVFITESGYRIKLYHPTFFVLFLCLFVIMEAGVLMLSPAGAGSRRGTTAIGSLSGHNLRALMLLILVLLLLLSVLSVFLMSRYYEQAKKSGGGLMEPTLFRFDFSRYIKLESQIEVSDDLVMLLRKDGPADKILLRRFILSEYDQQRGFYQSRNNRFEHLPVAVSDSPEDLNDPGYRERVGVKQEYFLVNFDPTSLVGMNYPVRIVPLKNWDASSFVRIYRVNSKVSRASSEDLLGVEPPPMEPDFLELYTRYGGDEEIQHLAQEITAGQQNYCGKVMALVNYLREGYLYSLRPGLAEDGDQLKHFLFKSRKGYCSYFAFAMALMARSLGIPARVAVGFLVDPNKEVLNFYEIRAYQAHAWVEVYFGDLGWIEFDPTSENLAPDQDIRFLFGFDFEHLSSLIEEILSHQQLLAEEMAETPSFTSSLLRIGEGVMRGVGLLARFWYITLPVLYLLTLLALKLRFYALYLLAREERQKIKHLYRFSLSAAYSMGWIRNPDESLLEYSERQSREHSLLLGPWTQHYLKAVFSESYDKRDFTEGMALYHDFARSLKRALAPPVRLLAFLNPLGSLRRRG